MLREGKIWWAHSGQGAVTKNIYGWLIHRLETGNEDWISRGRGRPELHLLAQMLLQPASTVCRKTMKSERIAMAWEKWGKEVCPLDLLLSLAPGKVLLILECVNSSADKIHFSLPLGTSGSIM